MDLAIVVNNAGIAYDKKLSVQKPEHVRELAIVNTYPYVLMTSALLPLLKQRGNFKSCIVNLSSSASFQPAPLLGLYAATKVFDRFFSEALWQELSQSGSPIEVMTVCPMFVQTNMTSNVQPNWSTGVTSCEQYVTALINSLAHPKPCNLFVGPPQHTIQSMINQVALGMSDYFRYPLGISESFIANQLKLQEATAASSQQNSSR